VVAHGVQPVSAVLVTQVTGQVGGRGVLDICWPAWANFIEFRKAEVRRIPLPRNRVNKGNKKGRYLEAPARSIAAYHRLTILEFDTMRGAIKSFAEKEG
jgi:hypothetical protein